MAGLLYVYSRTSIQAAKRNARQHREADGGQISWQNESLRRHGVIEKPGENGILRELFGQVKPEAAVVVRQGKGEEEKIRARRVSRKESGEQVGGS